MAGQRTRIHLCGRLTAELEGQRIEDALPGRQGRLLFAYLVLGRERPVRRDELLDVLWPEDGPPPSGDSLLAPPLSRLRKALGDGRLQGREQLSLELPADAWVDWEAAFGHLADCRAAVGGSDWAAAWQSGRAAVEIADGGLLPGLEAVWIDERRAELGELRVEALEAVATSGARLGGGELSAAEEAARAAVEAAPFRESARVALIGALRAGGNDAEALRAFEDIRVLLRDELGTTPGPALLAMHEQLLGAGDPATAARPATAVATPAPPGGRVLPDRLAQAAATPWVGRRTQLERLQGELEAARDGHTGLVLLTGEGGIGKTRLLAELAAGAEGFAVLYGRCDEEELVPFGPWIEMLGAHLAGVDDAELPGLLGHEAGDLARLLPELRSRVTGLEEPSPTDPETERRRLFSAVEALVTRLAERSPLILMIDDLHWADRSSLLLGRHLARATGLGRTLMLGTYRDTELTDRHPLQEVLADLEREAPLDRVGLAGMGPEEVAELVGAHADGLGADTVRAIGQETHGNPFFVKQLLRHIQEEGPTRPDGGFGLSAGLRDVIARRVDRLPEEAGRVLRVAALTGRDFELGVVERVVDLPEDELLDLLDAAVRAGILVEVRSTPGRYSFVHALLRTALEEQLTATRRARLHRRIGEAIEGRFRDRIESHLDDLARHFAAAGPEEVDRAVTYAERAAEQATGRLAHEEAADLLAGAVAARERDEPVDQLDRARLLLLLAAARMRAGQWDAARDTHALAAAAAREAGAPVLLGQAALGHSGGLWERFGTEDPDSVELLREALDLLPADDSRLRAQLLARLSGVLYYSPGSEQTTAPLAQEAIAMARRLEDDQALATALAAAQYAFWRPGQAEARAELADELAAVTARLGDLEARAGAYAWQVIVLLELCRLEEADAAMARHAELAERLQQPELLVHAAALRSMRALLEGDWEKAEQAAQDVLSAGERSTAVDALQFYGVEMIAMRNEQLRMDEISQHFGLLAREIAALPGWRTPVAWAHVQAGRLDMAYAELDDIRRDDFAVLPYDANFDAALAIVSHIAGELDDAELAAQVEPLLRPLAEYWVVLGPAPATLGPVAYSLGLLNLIRGHLDAAERDFELALAKSRSMGARPYEAHSLFGASEVIRRRDGDTEAAARLRDEALAIARELDMTRLLRDAGGR